MHEARASRQRAAQVREACKKYGGFYLGSIGGPAARLAEHSIKKVDVIEYPELGMEAIWRIEVEDFLAFIVVNHEGKDFYAALASKRPQPLVQIRSVVGRCCKPRIDMHYQHGPISTVAGYYAKDILWPNAGVGPEEIDLTGSYDAFTFTTRAGTWGRSFCAQGSRPAPLWMSTLDSLTAMMSLGVSS